MAGGGWEGPNGKRRAGRARGGWRRGDADAEALLDCIQAALDRGESVVLGHGVRPLCDTDGT